MPLNMNKIRKIRTSSGKAFVMIFMYIKKILCIVGLEKNVMAEKIKD